MADKKDDVFDLKGIRLLVELMKENNVSDGSDPIALKHHPSPNAVRRTNSALPNTRPAPICALRLRHHSSGTAPAKTSFSTPFSHQLHG